MVSLSDCSTDYQHAVLERRRFWSRCEDLAVGTLAIASLLFLYSPQFQQQRQSLNLISYRETTTISTANSNEIVAIANSWVDKEFNPGESAQCAYFVRHVLSEAGVNPGVTSNPIDGYETSEGYANSFFGDDIGTLIMEGSQLKPGDLVAFSNTYGDWPAGTITHVGIYVGNGEMVDRPTASKPVQKRSISTFDFAVGVRLMSGNGGNLSQSPKGDTDLMAIAARLESEYGIPAKFTKAVGNHETGNGNAVIGSDNWFGVKGSGETVTTTEYIDGQLVIMDDGFCSEGCPDSFARTVVNILKEQGKSPKGMSPEAIADAVGSVYATDPKWADKVKTLLN